jgi:GNAT superfamily N-acetyltransferase
MGAIDYLIAPFPADAALDGLWRRAWGAPLGRSLQPVLARSLTHVFAYAGDRLVGFVNVAWDGGLHAFILDTTTDPDYQRRGIGTELVRRAAEICRAAGIEWLHVDYEEPLAPFYAACGFRPTAAGLLRLATV